MTPSDAGAPPIHRWNAITAPRALVHVVHGMSEHAARYGRFAVALNRAGYVVWAHDHRGHGLNPTPPVGPGHFGDHGGWRALIDDARAVSGALQAMYPTVPLVLFAHSMGSFVGQALIAEAGDAYRAVVLSGTNGPPGAREAALRGIARLQRRMLGAHAPGRWTQRLVMNRYNRHFAPTRTTADWLSRDPAEVDRFLADPLCGAPLTTQAWHDLLEGKRGLGADALLRRIPAQLPILLIAGTRDPVGENARGVRRLLARYRRAGLQRVDLKLYDEARHELVNETNREAVTADVIAWIERAIA